MRLSTLALTALALFLGAAARAGAPLNVSVPDGSTPQQVTEQLGAPDGRYTQALGGRQRTIWVYGSSRRRPILRQRTPGAVSPQDSPFLGLGAPRPDTPVYPDDYHERLYVIFENGRVTGTSDVLP